MFVFSTKDDDDTRGQGSAHGPNRPAQQVNSELGACRACRADGSCALSGPSDFTVTPQIDACLNTLARRAKTDPAIRNALYGLLSIKIARFVRRQQSVVARHAGQGPRPKICEPEDVAQEAFLVFEQIVQRWPETGPFSGYFFSRFPWRLARAIDQIERGRSALPVTSLDDLDGDDVVYSLDPAGLSWLEEMTGELSERERVLLDLRLSHGLRWPEVARALRVNTRTLYRLRDRLVTRLRTSWLDERAGLARHGAGGARRWRA